MKPYKVIGPKVETGKQFHPERSEGGRHYNMVMELADATGQSYYMRYGTMGYYPVAYFDAGPMLHYRDLEDGQLVFSRQGRDNIDAIVSTEPLEILAAMLDYFKRYNSPPTGAR